MLMDVPVEHFRKRLSVGRRCLGNFFGNAASAGHIHRWQGSRVC
jgi:hypothetical protein